MINLEAPIESIAMRYSNRTIEGFEMCMAMTCLYTLLVFTKFPLSQFRTGVNHHSVHQNFIPPG